MTKLAIITGLFLVCLFLVALTASFVSLADPNAIERDATITTLAARKEELLASRIRIEQQLSALNESVQQALQEQQALDLELKSAPAATAGQTSTSLTTTLSPITLPTIPTTTPKPAQKPAPRPVTRAS